MKKIISPLIGTLLFLSVVMSCKKSFFETTSQDGSITDASAFQSKADYESALIGSYASLVGDNVSGYLWVTIPGLVSQDWVNNTLSPVPIDNMLTSGNSQFLDYWTNLYKIVSEANLVLTKITTAPADVLTDADKVNLAAQAKFLRGYAYFSISRAYGDVPMPLSAYTPDQNSLGCTPQQDVFKQIVKDLSEAAADLPEADNWGAADQGRATKGAALAYLANAYMYLEDWTNAAKASTDLFALNSPKYVLAADVHTPFSVIGKNTPEYKKENIFEIQYRDNADDNFHWGDVPNGGSTLAALTSPRTVGDKWASAGGWGEYMINITAVNAYDPNDDRRKKLVKIRGEEYKGEFMTDTMRAADWATNNQPNVGFSTKYWLGNFNPTAYLSPQNLPMMRFAEVLLNYSEILFREGKNQEAYDNLNLVRSRAKLSPLTASSNAETFISDLMKERRSELLFEPNLWFHYTRTGTAAAFMRTNYNITWQEKWAHFPIPERERSVNPNLCSNGY